MRVLVIQVDDETDVNLIVLKVIDERPAARIAAQRPAHRVGHRAFAVLGGVDLPDLFHAKAEFLRAVTLGQFVLRDHFFRQRSAHAFRQEDVFPVQFHPRLVSRPRLARFRIAPEFARHDALHAVALIDQRRGAHPREDLHAQALGHARHPAADIGHGNDVIAVVVHQRRHGEIGDAHLPGGAKDIEVVLFHLGLDRRAHAAPVGQQGIQTRRVKHRARQDMRADLGSLFKHDHRQVGIKLLQPDRRRQAGRACAHDHHVIFHRLTDDVGHPACSFPAFPCQPRKIVAGCRLP